MIERLRTEVGETRTEVDQLAYKLLELSSGVPNSFAINGGMGGGQFGPWFGRWNDVGRHGRGHRRRNEVTAGSGTGPAPAPARAQIVRRGETWPGAKVDVNALLQILALCTAFSATVTGVGGYFAVKVVMERSRNSRPPVGALLIIPVLPLGLVR